MIRIHIKFLFPKAHNKPTVFFRKKKSLRPCLTRSFETTYRLGRMNSKPSLSAKKNRGGKTWIWLAVAAWSGFQDASSDDFGICWRWCSAFSVVFLGEWQTTQSYLRVFFSIKPWKFQWNQDPILRKICFKWVVQPPTTSSFCWVI